MLKWLTTLGLCLLLVGTAVAQDRDEPTIADIFFDTPIEGALTQEAFYDWYRLSGVTGDQIVVNMQAFDGLLPLLGILNSAGDLVGRSDDGGINDNIQLEYTIPEDGIYTIVATRVGNAEGTSTGGYDLQVRLANPDPIVVNPYQEVVFRCQDFEVTTAATVLLSEDTYPDMVYRITIYGIDGFQPVLRIRFTAGDVDVDNCETDAQRTIGDTFTLPGEETRTVTEETLNTVVQHRIAGAEDAGIITLTVGSRDGSTGRYMMLIEGLGIDPRNDFDIYELRVGPQSAATTGLQVYMVAGSRSRLDPFLAYIAGDQECDDAGRSPCDAVPSFDGAGATLNEGDTPTTLTGDRNDAGLLLLPGSPDPMIIEASSRNSASNGEYTLVIIGELPPR